MRDVKNGSTKDSRSAALFALALLAGACSAPAADDTSRAGNDDAQPTDTQTDDATPDDVITGGSDSDHFDDLKPEQLPTDDLVADEGEQDEPLPAEEGTEGTIDDFQQAVDPNVQNPVCSVPPASAHQASRVGGAAGTFKESAHFRVYGGAAGADTGLKLLEAAHKCFVEDWCWRSPGLPINQTGTSPIYKFNAYTSASLGNAAGVMKYDARAGLSYLQVITRSIGEARVTVHEYGHAMTLAAGGWVDQTRTGAWWETIANFVADTFMNSSYCAAARTQYAIPTGGTLIDLNKIVGNAQQLIVNNQNYYEAWPFFTYLTNNPDKYQGLGRMVVPNLFKAHTRKNETPLHVLEKVAAPVKVQTILGRYWAHMAYLDIGHPKARDLFFQTRSRLNFANLDAAGSGTWRVKSARRPQYGGANIIPLKASGNVSVKITNLGNGRAESDFTATLAIRATSAGTVRYVDLPKGTGQATIAAGEEASLVVVNTPTTLYQYDAFKTTAAELAGLNYQVQLTGATPAN